MKKSTVTLDQLNVGEKFKTETSKNPETIYCKTGLRTKNKTFFCSHVGGQGGIYFDSTKKVERVEK